MSEPQEHIPSLSQDNKQEIKQKIKDLIILKEDTFKFVNRVLKQINIIDDDEEVVDIRELLTNEKQVNIRTETNRVLRSL